MKTKLSVMRRFAVIAAFLAVAAGVRGAASATFKDTWTDTGSVDSIDQFDNVNSTGSFSVSINVPLDGTDLSEADFDSSFSLSIGPSGGTIPIISDTLGDASRFAGKSATFPIFGNDVDINGNPITVGSVTVSWTTTTLTVTGTAKMDVLQEEPMYSGNSFGEPGSQPVLGPYEIAVSLDASDNNGGTFNFDNQYVTVTGSDKETEYNGGGFGPVPLENGSVSGTANFTPPKVSITSPAANFKVNDQNTVVQLKGTASAGQWIDSVEVYLNTNYDNPIDIDQEGDFPTNALSWTASVDLSQGGQPGPNVITVVLTDTAGDTNAVSRTYVWVETSTAALTINPLNSGTIKGKIQNGATLQKGVGYSVTATPASKAWIFADWTDDAGDVLSSNATFVYLDTDGTLTANFVANPFNNSQLAGTYTGLFYDQDNGLEVNDSGYITMKVTGTGGYTASLYLASAGRSFPLSGQMSPAPDGSPIASATGKITVSKSEFLQVLIQVATDTTLADPGAGVMSGVVNAFSDAAETDPIDSAEIQGELSLPNAKIGVGKYNVVIGPASADPSTGPGGYGYGSATVSKTGTVTTVLNLADGVSPAITFNGSTAQDGTCPFYASLYGGKGVILGWLQFATNGSDGVQGLSMNWVKGPVADKYYTTGFTATPTLSGALYTAPKSGANVLGWTAGTFAVDPTYAGLSLPDETDFAVTFNPAKNTFSDASKVTITFTPSTGAVSGSFYAAGAKSATTFKGVETMGAGYGFYLGANKETGPVRFQSP
jgi:hypothetical protein